MYQVPTDSLYKFCAITGIIIIIFSTYFPYSISNDLNKKIIDMEYEASALKVETNYTKNNIDFLVKIISSDIKENNNSKISKQYLDILEKTKLLTKEYDIQIKKIEITNKNLKKTSTLSGKIFKIGIYGLIFGTILSIYGFFMWYTKIQVHQDKLLLKSLEND